MDIKSVKTLNDQEKSKLETLKTNPDKHHGVVFRNLKAYQQQTGNFLLGFSFTFGILLVIFIALTLSGYGDWTTLCVILGVSMILVIPSSIKPLRGKYEIEPFAFMNAVHFVSVNFSYATHYKMDELKNIEQHGSLLIFKFKELRQELLFDSEEEASLFLKSFEEKQIFFENAEHEGQDHVLLPIENIGLSLK
jgi:hypothetical protein